MHIEQLREYCIAKKGVTEHFPFDNDTLVFKVLDKMFVMVPLDRWEQGNYVSVVKTDVEWAEELRDSYEGFIGGFQMSRKPNAKYVFAKHWNSISHHLDIKDEFAFELIDHSYEMVIKGMTKKQRAALDKL